MMKRLARLHKDSQGFTLVELMIVVAIIGILAAIAIPQFAAYRIRGYNASAQSDVRNLATTNAAFFSDWQIYGTSAAAAGVGGGNGAVLTGGGAGPYLVTGLAGGANRSTAIGVGNNINVLCHVSDGTLAGIRSTFVAGAKHLQGNTVFGVDAEASAVFQDPTALGVGAPMVAATLPQAAVLTTGDNLTGFATFVIK